MGCFEAQSIRGLGLVADEPIAVIRFMETNYSHIDECLTKKCISTEARGVMHMHPINKMHARHCNKVSREMTGS